MKLSTTFKTLRTVYPDKVYLQTLTAKTWQLQITKNTLHSFSGGSQWYKIPENLKELKMHASKYL